MMRRRGAALRDIMQDETGWGARFPFVLVRYGIKQAEADSLIDRPIMRTMDFDEHLARNLATALLSAEWRLDRLLERCAAVVGRRMRATQGKLIAELLRRHLLAYPPSPEWLVAFLLGSEHFDRLAEARAKLDGPLHTVLEVASFAPARRFLDLDIAELRTPSDVAHWLGLSLPHLEWLSDARRQSRHTEIPVLQNYVYRFVPKRCGPPRLIEEPKPRLKAAQRLILREILDLVPLHDCAHGFAKGRSCVTSARIHASENIVVTLDLVDFFPRTPLRRVHGVFRSLGYPWAVARVLTGLVSTATPVSVFERLPSERRPDRWTQMMLGSPHLPQGAPTSPVLANLAAWRLDVRLSALASAYGANCTRYADDLAFSGDWEFAGRLGGFLAKVRAIASDEGWNVNERKTRVMRRGHSQRITGIVVNDHVNVPRADYDNLKAVLNNAVRHGPDGQNRGGHADFRAHLDGRVTWVESVNPRRGAKLRRLFDAVRW
jgi:retron-type reverse transcriptase